MQGERKLERPKIETDADWKEKDTNSWKLSSKVFDEGTNPRLIAELNLTGNAPFVAVLQLGEMPIAVMVCRADMDMIALGAAEKMKDAVKNYHRKAATEQMMKKPSILSPTAMPKLPPPPRVQ